MTVWIVHDGKCVRRCSEKRAVSELGGLAEAHGRLSARVDRPPGAALLQQLARSRVPLVDRCSGLEILGYEADAVVFTLGDSATSGFPPVLKTNYLHFICAMEAILHCDPEYLNFSALEGFPEKPAQFAVRLCAAPKCAAAWQLEPGRWCELQPRNSFGRNVFLVDGQRVVADSDYAPSPGSLRPLFPGVPVLMTGERFYQMLQLSRRQGGLLTHSLFESAGKKYQALVTFHIDVFPSLQRIIAEQAIFSDTIFGF